MVAMRWQLEERRARAVAPGEWGREILVSQVVLSAWAHANRLALPRPAIEVLLRHACAAAGPPPGPAERLRRVLETLARDPAPLVCLADTPGALDPFSQGEGYVAAAHDASKNLLEHVTEAQWLRIREAARSQLAAMVLRGGGVSCV